MRTLLSGATLLAFLGLAGCETVKGAGRDLETAGKAIAPPGTTYRSESSATTW